MQTIQKPQVDPRVHINTSATSKEAALEQARAQLDEAFARDVVLVERLFAYVEERVLALKEPSNGQAVEITADISIEVAAYLRIA